VLAPSDGQADPDQARRYLASRLEVDPAAVVMPSTRVAGWKSHPYFVRGDDGPVHLGDHPMAAFELVRAGMPPLAHRIYTGPAGCGKAEVVDGEGNRLPAKKLSRLPSGVRSAAGYVVVFGHPGCETMVVAEGIEDGAALAYCLREEIERGEVVVVASMSASTMDDVELYPGTKRLIVAAHRDEGKPRGAPGWGTGGRAAGRLVRKVRRLRRRLDRIGVVLPGSPGTKMDWLELLLDRGVQAVRDSVLGGPAVPDGAAPRVADPAVPEEAVPGERAPGGSGRQIDGAASRVADPDADLYFAVGSDVEVAHRLVADLRAANPGGVVAAEGVLWRYTGTHWEALDDAEVRRLVHSYDGIVYENRLGKTAVLNLSKNRIDGIVHEAMVHVSATRFFEKPAVGINCATGFLQFTGGGRLEQVPHSPAHRCRAVLPAPYPVKNFDARFRGSLLERLLDGCFCGDPDALEKVRAVQEIAGVALAGYGTRLKNPKVAIFHGPKAANGKSQLIDMIYEVVPATARSAVPAQEFGDEKHRVRLRGSVLNAVAEISADGISTNAFNLIVAGDIVTARDVYKSGFEFRPMAQHIFSCNELPSFRHGLNRGVRRRLMVIPFHHVTPENEQVPDIGKRIAEEECDLLLHWAVEGAARAASNGRYTPLASSEEAVREWVLGEDPVIAWLTNGVRVTRDPEHRVAKAETYRRFTQWAEAEGFSRAEMPRQGQFTSRVLANSEIGEDRSSTTRLFTGLVVEDGPCDPPPRPRRGDPSQGRPHRQAPAGASPAGRGPSAGPPPVPDPARAGPAGDGRPMGRPVDAGAGVAAESVDPETGEVVGRPADRPADGRDPAPVPRCASALPPVGGPWGDAAVPGPCVTAAGAVALPSGVQLRASPRAVVGSAASDSLSPPGNGALCASSAGP
jgi:P4 family phage/plasmid primase-like protien